VLERAEMLRRAVDSRRPINEHAQGVRRDGVTAPEHAPDRGFDVIAGVPESDETGR
jgi:hypothetical protein